MDIQISTAGFLRFLNRCRAGKMVKDLLIQIRDGQIYSRFTDENKVFFAEVYETAGAVKEDSAVKIPSIQKLIDCLKRSDSTTVRLKSNGNAFVVYDGVVTGKMSVKCTEVASEDYIESWAKNNCKNISFDKTKLVYCNMQYSNGYKVPIESLEMICGDAKAFDLDLFKFFIEKVTKPEPAEMLSCDISEPNTKDTFNRKLAIVEKIGADFKPTVVGAGLREIVIGIKEGFVAEKKDDPRRNVSVYFGEKSVLFTDNQSYFYNLHSI